MLRTSKFLRTSGGLTGHAAFLGIACRLFPACESLHDLSHRNKVIHKAWVLLPKVKRDNFNKIASRVRRLSNFKKNRKIIKKVTTRKTIRKTRKVRNNNNAKTRKRTSRGRKVARRVVGQKKKSSSSSSKKTTKRRGSIKKKNTKDISEWHRFVRKNYRLVKELPFEERLVMLARKWNRS